MARSGPSLMLGSSGLCLPQRTGMGCCGNIWGPASAPVRESREGVPRAKQAKLTVGASGELWGVGGHTLQLESTLWLLSGPLCQATLGQHEVPSLPSPPLPGQKPRPRSAHFRNSLPRGTVVYLTLPCPGCLPSRLPPRVAGKGRHGGGSWTPAASGDGEEQGSEGQSGRGAGCPHGLCHGRTSSGEALSSWRVPVSPSDGLLPGPTATSREPLSSLPAEAPLTWQQAPPALASDPQQPQPSLPRQPATLGAPHRRRSC